MKKVLLIIGTRPNFIKVTQFKKFAQLFNIDLRIVHTGQHYDEKMSGVFFKQFKLQPDFFLNIPKGISASEQIANIILELNNYTKKEFSPDIVLAVGDVNSTLATALFAHKSGIKLGHIESGLRSNDLGMPEEINRILTDKITDLFFVTEQSGYDNLINERIDENRIFFVGNTMIDTLVSFEEDIEASSILESLSVNKNKYALMTMHRPATVDSKEGLIKMLEIIDFISNTRKLIFPIHPRTKNNLIKFGLEERINNNSNLIICPPIGYFEFQKLIKHSSFVITDSGGIQEETTFRQVPCLTLRPNTERPSTINIGSNTLVPFDLKIIKSLVESINSGSYKKGEIPRLWDGNATQRIFESL